MRRKVIQDFANVFCQRFVDLPSGFDVATFVALGSGTVCLDILSGQCTHDGIPCRSLSTCAEYRIWLGQQCEKHHLPLDAIRRAVMTIAYTVADVTARRSTGMTRRGARFTFDCRSEIATDEKTYTGRAAGGQIWGFDYYWDKLYGEAEPPVAKPLQAAV